jgi:hypothetical protein
VATRKQRRRRAKEKRHEYEVVYLDSEGNEVEPDEVEPPKAGKSPARAASKSSGLSSKSSRLVREPKPPSWSRAARRGAIFMPILIGVVILTNRKNTSPLGIILIAIVFTGLVIPFGYFTDHLAYRAYQKRVVSKPSSKSPKR